MQEDRRVADDEARALSYLATGLRRKAESCCQKTRFAPRREVGKAKVQIFKGTAYRGVTGPKLMIS